MALRILNLSIRQRWVVSCTLRQSYPRKNISGSRGTFPIKVKLSLCLPKHHAMELY